VQLFSVIVFGCISNQGWDKDQCRYNGDTNACSFGTVVGVMAFFGLIILLVIDALFENISGVQHRKYAVIGDMGFSGQPTDSRRLFLPRDAMHSLSHRKSIRPFVCPSVPDCPSHSWTVPIKTACISETVSDMVIE